MSSEYETLDLLVFAHLRWDFVFQRPQHLLTRFAKHRRVFYFEEPVFGMTDHPRLHIRETTEGVQVIVPHLPSNEKKEDIEMALKELVDEIIFEGNIQEYSCWYYSPQARAFTRHLKPRAIIFDCMDDIDLELEDSELIRDADLIFTDGHSLSEGKNSKLHNIHSFPSSIDYAHFCQGRMQLVEPDDQINIPHPRIGFYGVLDERFDTQLLSKMADLRPEWQFVLVGPVMNIDAANMPKQANIHYLGIRDYHTLPLYLSGWDCAMMPLALNRSTRFIGPTKTLEYLAAGRPVVSTAIQDVASPYAQAGLVYIADTPELFIASAEKAMEDKKRDQEWLEKVDSFLAKTSWDQSFESMAKLEKELYQTKFPSQIEIGAEGVV